MQGVVFMNEDNNKSSQQRYDLPGSITLAPNKVEMITILIEQYMKPKKICFLRDFVVAETEYAVHEEVIKEYTRQLRGFCRKRMQRTDHEGEIYYETTYPGTSLN